MSRKYKYIYGPVPSWRLGSSLGIDPISAEGKICSFDCIYCQLGKTKLLRDERKIFVPTEKIIEELNSLPPLKIDYITFSGTGEPTLAKNLGDMIRSIKKIKNNKIAVLTNSSLIDRKDVQDDLLLADFVVAKLDASSQKTFELINKPMEKIKFRSIVQAIKNFRKIYKGRLALQSMFVEDNKIEALGIAKIAKEIRPDEMQINTPLRPCSVKPLSKTELEVIEKYFEGLKTASVYKAEKKKIRSVSDEDTLRRRGKI